MQTIKNEINSKEWISFFCQDLKFNIWCFYTLSLSRYLSKIKSDHHFYIFVIFKKFLWNVSIFSLVEQFFSKRNLIFNCNPHVFDVKRLTYSVSKAFLFLLKVPFIVWIINKFIFNTSHNTSPAFHNFNGMSAFERSFSFVIFCDRSKDICWNIIFTQEIFLNKNKIFYFSLAD